MDLSYNGKTIIRVTAEIYQVLVIALKAFGVIDWSWGAVLIPLWICLFIVAWVLLWMAVYFWKKARKKNK